MPPKKTGEAQEAEGQCILKLGKSNNIIQWTDEMKTSISLFYGVAGNFLTTNVRHEYSIPLEEDYIPVLPAPEEGQPAIPPLPVVTKLREFAFERRNKQIAQLVENGQKVFLMMWERCSPASQSKIREDPDFEDAALALDPVRLWGFIRRTHLTHIFGVGDPMTEVNIQEQLARFASLKQGEREHVAPFKIRFDNQVKANLGAGVPDVSDSTRALEMTKDIVECFSIIEIRHWIMTRMLTRKHFRPLTV
jgi:hypothetical protein